MRLGWLQRLAFPGGSIYDDRSRREALSQECEQRAVAALHACEQRHADAHRSVLRQFGQALNQFIF